MQKTITVTPDSTRCSTCMLNDICLPLGMPRNDVAKLDELIKERIRIPKAGALFRLGDKVEAVYGLRSGRSEEHTSELQSLMRISYAVFCLKKKNNTNHKPKMHSVQ